MSLIWHGKPAFPATHLNEGTVRYRVGASGAVAVGKRLNVAVASLADQAGAVLVPEEAMRALIVLEMSGGPPAKNSLSEWLLLERIVACGQESLSEDYTLEQLAGDLLSAWIMAPEALDDRRAGLRHFADASIRMRVNAERAPFERQALSALLPEEIPGDGEYIVDWNGPGTPTLAGVQAVLNPPAPPTKTLDEKLAAAGLTVADIKAAMAK